MMDHMIPHYNWAFGRQFLYSVNLLHGQKGNKNIIFKKLQLHYAIFQLWFGDIVDNMKANLDIRNVCLNQRLVCIPAP